MLLGSTRTFVQSYIAKSLRSAGSFIRNWRAYESVGANRARDDGCFILIGLFACGDDRDDGDRGPMATGIQGESAGGDEVERNQAPSSVGTVTSTQVVACNDHLCELQNPDGDRWVVDASSHEVGDTVSLVLMNGFITERGARLD